jgi:acetylornithine deacetylase/succinyl-diaminopimelate desuccinylase-like protein
MKSAALEAADADRQQAEERLERFLAIPSVSTDPSYEPQVHEAAAWLRDTLADLGLEAEIRPTDGHPAVLAFTAAGDAPADAPRVLFYGHYDVQPPDPLEHWRSPPFEPTVRDGSVFARGAADDKGQVAAFLEALRAWRRAGDQLPVHLTVLIEGEEEVGSRNLPAFLQRHREELVDDVGLISDTAMWDRQTVAITYGLRGLLYYDLQLHNANRDLHSGLYGGILANPATLMGRVLGALFDEDNRVTVSGFYDDVAPLSEEEQARWAALDVEPVRDVLGPLGVDTPYGEAGFSTLARRWARPACDVNGLYGGYEGEGAKTVIPSYAGAKVSFRLAPDQDPDRIAQRFTEWLQARDVGGCRWQITEHGRAEPVRLALDSPWIAAAQRACRAATGREAVLMREGATIPVVAALKNTLNMEPLLMGFALASDQIHAPDEHFGLDRFALATRTHVELLASLAEK